MKKQKSGIVGLFQKMFRWEIIVGLAGIIAAIYTVKAYYKEEPKIDSPSSISKQEEVSSSFEQEENIKIEVDKKQALLERFCGDYTYVAHIGPINYVYTLVLDPINSKANWEEDDISITNSLGYYGSSLSRTPEAWEITNFTVNVKDSSAIITLVCIYSIYGKRENSLCSVKLSFDDYDRIKMEFIEGNDAPVVLGDIEDNGGETAIFTREMH